MDEIIIGMAQAEQIPALASLVGALFSIELDFKVDRTKQERALAMLLARPDQAAVFCAQTMDGKAVGMVSMQLVVSTAEGGMSAWLEDLYVDADYRRRGIAQSLLERAIDWALSHGASRVQLLADKSNHAALDFYKRRAWKQGQMVALVTRPGKP